MRYAEYPLIEEVPIRRLSGSEYALLAWLSVRIVVVLAVLPVALRCLTVARLVRLLTPRRMGATRRPALLWRSAGAVDRLVDRRPFRFWGHCLRRSLLLYFVATRAGYSVQVVVGARRDGSGVTGHAWIELDGRPLLEPGEHPEQSFIVMERLPRQ
ncbi:MAG TPA: lasso peptide biosynthesis B2 protein [Ktedonobacterales bacterium]|nr:lasso peptide biosynthesis B2 protein [Ktedonobacterales bacterium]